MFGCKEGRRRPRFVVDDHVDAALAPEIHILGAMASDMGETQSFENRFQDTPFKGREFYKFKST